MISTAQTVSFVFYPDFANPSSGSRRFCARKAHAPRGDCIHRGKFAIHNWVVTVCSCSAKPLWPYIPGMEEEQKNRQKSYVKFDILRIQVVSFQILTRQGSDCSANGLYQSTGTDLSCTRDFPMQRSSEIQLGMQCTPTRILATRSRVTLNFLTTTESLPKPSFATGILGVRMRMY